MADKMSAEELEAQLLAGGWHYTAAMLREQAERIKKLEGANERLRGNYRRSVEALLKVEGELTMLTADLRLALGSRRTND